MQRVWPSAQTTSIPARLAVDQPALLRWLAPGLVLAGLLLRLSLLTRPGLHPDEALYASWALRIATGIDPLLLGVYVDKPPLAIYLWAGLFRLSGASPLAPFDHEHLILLARLASLAASQVSLVLLYHIAHQLYGRRTALAATALFAASPLAVGLAPTLFTDPLLVLWMLLALWAALGRRSWLTGLACGLAYATKQQGVLLFPLILATFAIAQQPGRAGAGRILQARADASSWRSAWRASNGFLLVAVIVLWWDSQRWQWMPSYWDRSLATYGGLGLVPLTELPTRLADWAELLGYAAGSPLLAVALVLGLPLVIGQAWHWHAAMARKSQLARGTTRASLATGLNPAGVRMGPGPLASHPGHVESHGTMAARFDLALVVYAAGYLLLHVVGSFAAWDRYALPLVPLLALLLARAAQHVSRSWRLGPLGTLAPAWAGWMRRLALGLAGLVLLQGAWLSVATSLPVGDASAYDGAAQLATYLRRTQADEAILYYQRLGWHLDFYLHDRPLEAVWWETPDTLADIVQARSGTESRQLLVALAGQDLVGVHRALAARGFQTLPVRRILHADGTLSLTLFDITLMDVGANGDAP